MEWNAVTNCWYKRHHLSTLALCLVNVFQETIEYMFIFYSFLDTELAQVIEILTIAKDEDLFILHSQHHAADGLVMKGARAWAAMVLTLFSQK